MKDSLVRAGIGGQSAVTITSLASFPSAITNLNEFEYLSCARSTVPRAYNVHMIAYVLGAGASVHAGYPLASKLLHVLLRGWIIATNLTTGVPSIATASFKSQRPSGFRGHSWTSRGIWTSASASDFAHNLPTEPGRHY